MPHPSDAILIIGEDLCGTPIPDAVIVPLLESLLLTEPLLHIILALKRGRKFDAGKPQITTIHYTHHPVEVLFQKTVLEHRSIFVVAANQTITNDWLQAMRRKFQSSPSSALQSELGITISEKQIFYPSPTWRNTGNSHPLLEHGGFIIASEALQSLSAQECKDWITLSRQLLAKGHALFLSKEIKTIEQPLSRSPWRIIRFILKQSLHISPTTRQPTDLPNLQKKFFTLQKMDAGRVLLAQQSGTRNVQYGFIATVNIIISFLVSLYRELIPYKTPETTTRHPVSFRKDASVFSLHKKFWILYEDDRIRLGEWDGGSNIVARSSSYLFFHALLEGETNFDEIVSRLAQFYRQPTDTIKKDLEQYVDQLLNAGVLIKDSPA